MKYAISACLMGVNCKYNGGNNACKELIGFMKDKEYVCVCPEVSGGLPIPRASCEIRHGRIWNTEGKDMTYFFVKGAELEMKKMKEQRVTTVVLQSRSPSCGKGEIYDGNFSGVLKKGNGIFAQLCIDNEFKVFDCMELLGKISNID